MRLSKLLLLSLLSACLLSFAGGCTVTSGVKYVHDSSIPDYHDWNESNMAGPYFNFLACPRSIPTDRCTQVEVSALWEFHRKGPNHTYGTNPVGNVEVRQPIWTYKRRE